MFWFAGKLRPQLGILCCNSDGARIEMAFTHHNATHCNQWCGGKTELFGAEQSRNNHITSRFQSTIGLQCNAASEIVQHQRLVRLSDSELPGQARVFDTGQRRSTCSTGISRDKNVVGMRFRNSRSDHANSHLAHQLYADPCSTIAILQIVDELR